jgi:hypothetical protein
VSELPDELQTISELGAAFAGFAALVSALAIRQGDQRVIDVTRLHIAVAGSLITVIGGLIPSVVDAHLPSSEHLWRLSAAALFTINYGYAVVYASWGKKLRGDRPWESRGPQAAFYGLEALVLLSIIACFAGLGSGAAFYLTALIALLAQAAAVFLGIVTSIVEHIAGDDAV